jgi:hypothetical protein
VHASCSPAVRFLLVATTLSACIVAGCGAWYQRLTEGNGPSGSVDLRPLAPIVTGVVLLLAVWLFTLVAWLFKASHKPHEEIGESKDLFRDIPEHWPMRVSTAATASLLRCVDHSQWTKGAHTRNATNHPTTRTPACIRSATVVPRRSRTRATRGRSATPTAAITSAYSHDFSETAMAAQVASAAVSRSGAPTTRASFGTRSRFLTTSAFRCGRFPRSFT